MKRDQLFITTKVTFMPHTWPVSWCWTDCGSGVNALMPSRSRKKLATFAQRSKPSFRSWPWTTSTCTLCRLQNFERVRYGSDC